MKHQPNADFSVLSALISDFSTEIDLHYEDEDLHALEPSIANLKNAALILERNEHPLPRAYLHILERYKKATAHLN